MLAFGVAMLLATPLGGVAADRFPKRSVLLVAVAMLVLSSLLVGLAVVTDTHPLLDAARSPAQSRPPRSPVPARPDRVHQPRWSSPTQIGPAIVMSQTTQEAMRVIAPALAGVLIGLSWFGVGGVFLIAAGDQHAGGRGAASAFRWVRRARDADPLADRRDGRRRPVRPGQPRPRTRGPDHDRRRHHRLPVLDVPADARRRALRRRCRRLRRDGRDRRARRRGRRRSWSSAGGGWCSGRGGRSACPAPPSGFR